MRTREEQSRTWSRSWSVTAPKLIVKLLSLAFLACLLIFKPASTVISSQLKRDSPSGHNVDRSRFSFDVLEDDLRNQQVARRTLLQATKFRPTPTGYPPPGDNVHVAPRDPSSNRRPP